MKIQAKKSTVPDGDRVISRIRMQKTVVNDGYFGFGNRNILTILKSHPFWILMGVLVATLDFWSGIGQLELHGARSVTVVVTDSFPHDFSN